MTLQQEFEKLVKKIVQSAIEETRDDTDTENRLDNLEESLGIIESKIERLEDSIDELKELIENMDSEKIVDYFCGEISSVHKSINGCTIELSKVYKDIGFMDMRINRLQKIVESNWLIRQLINLLPSKRK